MLIFTLLFLQFSSGIRAQKIRYNTQACTLTVTDKFKIQSVLNFESDYFKEVFGPKKHATVYINVYGDRKLYKKKDPPPGSQGFYRSGGKAVHVLYSSQYLHTCFHESSHAMFDVYAKNHPTWIDEGIAEYFEYSSVDTLGNVRVLESRYRKSEMKQAVKDGQLNISHLFGFSYLRFHVWREDHNYTLSWGVVNFMMKTHKKEFGTILYRIGTGVDSKKAIDDEYPGGVTQLEKDMVQHYK